MKGYASIMSLRTFLDAHRTSESDWNLTGMGSDVGKYHVSDEDYDTFLEAVHSHIFGSKPMASSLLERHKEVGPLLVDLDFRYAGGSAPLLRRFKRSHIKRFVAEYIATMVYFTNLEAKEEEIRFYVMAKPAPETEKGNHKDGIHIQCPDLVTNPKFQYAIRGFMLSHGAIANAFASTELTNPPEDVYDVAVIHRNNWFLYGACKPDKQQYRVKHILRISPADIAEALDGGTPGDMDELVEVIEDMLVEDPVDALDTWDLLKTLSIRRGITTSTAPTIRPVRQQEWDTLVGAWGSGKAKLEVRSAHEEERVPVAIPPDSEEQRRVTSSHSAEEIATAFRIARQCLNPEKRARQYGDWINLAICLRNISNSEESQRVWMEISRRVAGYESTMTDTEYKRKWDLLRGDDTKRLRYGSLIHWAKEDAPETLKAIQSETNRDWILNYAKETHVNVASFVVRMYGAEFRCSVGSKKNSYEWFQFGDKDTTPHSWRHLKTPTLLRARLSEDVRNQYTLAIAEYCRRIVTAGEAEKEILMKKRDNTQRIEKQLEMASFKDNVLKECGEKFYDEDFMSKLNCDPYLIGIRNGVLELQHYDSESMSDRPRVYFRPGRPDDNISFVMGRSEPDLEPIDYIPYDADSAEQRDLMSFFEKIYPDPVLRRYVLTLLSSCLEGQNREQRFYVNLGRGSNGTSMIQTLMRYTLGDYQTSLQTTALTRKRPESGAANPDMIVTKCKRYIYMGEPDQNEKLNTSRMKQLSGEDIVEARGLFSDQEKFKMMGKIFLACNDLPPVSSMDDGTWRRLRVIPHIATFVDLHKPANPAENIFHKDLHLEHKLRKWRTAFLSLLVHYYDTEYLVYGLREPDSVMVASNKYKEENDVFHTFLQENFVLEAGAGPVRKAEVMDTYKEWKKTQFGRAELKPKEIVERMRNVCDRKSTEKEFWGIRKLEVEEESETGSYLEHMP
jgi:P4 family phage/plasmid primase-like protien